MPDRQPDSSPRARAFDRRHLTGDFLGSLDTWSAPHPLGSGPLRGSAAAACWCEGTTPASHCTYPPPPLTSGVTHPKTILLFRVTSASRELRGGRWARHPAP